MSMKCSSKALTQRRNHGSSPTRVRVELVVDVIRREHPTSWWERGEPRRRQPSSRRGTRLSAELSASYRRLLRRTSPLNLAAPTALRSAQSSKGLLLPFSAETECFRDVKRYPGP